MTSSFLRPPHCALAMEPAALTASVAATRKRRVFIMCAMSNIWIGWIDTGQLFRIEVLIAELLLFLGSDGSFQLHDVPAGLDGERLANLEFRARNSQVLGIIR